MIDALYDYTPASKSSNSNLRTPDELSLKECLKGMGVLLETQVQTIIAIDAIDECQDYGRFLRLLKEVLPRGKNSVKIILSSKEGVETELARLFLSHATKKLDAKTNENDIKYYVDIQVKKRDSKNLGPRLLDHFCRTCNTPMTVGTCKDCKAREVLEDKLVKLLIEKSQGM